MKTPDLESAVLSAAAGEAALDEVFPDQSQAPDAERDAGNPIWRKSVGKKPWISGGYSPEDRNDEASAQDPLLDGARSQRSVAEKNI